MRILWLLALCGALVAGKKNLADFEKAVKALWREDSAKSPKPPDVGDTISKLDDRSQIQGAHVDAYFKLLSEENDGGTIAGKHFNTETGQREDNTVVLWTGPRGRAKAEEVDLKDSKYRFAEKRLHSNHWFTDTNITALSETFGFLTEEKGAHRINAEWKSFWDSVNCMWLLMTTGIPPEGINAYGSVHAYEKDSEGNLSPGKDELIRAKVDNAFVIGSYFWTTEILVLCKRGDVETVNINLLSYDLNDLDQSTALPKPTKWEDKGNIFGAPIPNFAVVFRDNSAQGVDKYANFLVQGVATFHDLLTAYNSRQMKAELRLPIQEGLAHKFEALKALVDYTKSISFAAKALPDAVPGRVEYVDMFPQRLLRFGGQQKDQYHGFEQRNDRALTDRHSGYRGYTLFERGYGYPAAAKAGYNDLNGHFGRYYDDGYDDDGYYDGEYYADGYYDGDYFDDDYGDDGGHWYWT